MSQRSAPMEGIRVLDVTQAIAGPYCAMLLADLGADVLKIESPAREDMSRAWGVFEAVNRNKRALAIDLKHPEGRALFLRLCEVSDVVINNFRPTIMASLGLDYDAVRAVSPRIIYASITGFGHTGPYAHTAANDITVQAITGLMATTGEDGGEPVKIGVPVIDVASGVFAFGGIATALYERERSGLGQEVHVSMVRAATALAANLVPDVLTRGKDVERLGSAHPLIAPYEAFMTGDGERIIVGAFTHLFWVRLCNAISAPELIEDSRFSTNLDRVAHRGELRAALNERFAERPRAEWEKILNDADIPWSPINSLRDGLTHEQMKAAETVITLTSEGEEVQVANLPIELSMAPPHRRGFPPKFARDTRDVLREALNLTEQELDSLVDNGVIATGRDG